MMARGICFLLIFFSREIKGIGKWANGNHNVLNKIDVRSWCAQVQFWKEQKKNTHTHNIEIILNVYAWCLLTTVHRISSAYLSYTRPWFAYAFRNSELRTGKMRIVKNEQWTTNTSWRWLKQTNERSLAPTQSSIGCMHYTKHTQHTQHTARHTRSIAVKQ